MRGYRRGRGGPPRGSSQGGSLSSRIENPQHQSSFPQRGGHHHGHQSNLVEVLFTGWLDTKFAATDDRGVGIFEQWIQRKAQTVHEKEAHTAGINTPHALRIRKSRTAGNTFIISVPPDDVRYYQKLDGYSWSNATINVKAANTASNGQQQNRSQGMQDVHNESFSFGGSKDVEEIKAKLKGLLSRRYDMNNKVLNLSSIWQEPEIQEMGGAGQTLYDHPKLIKVLCALCEDAFPTPEARSAAITGLQLGGNGLASLNIIKPMLWTFPDLINLDLSGNNIVRMEQLVAIRKLKKLQHVILNGNPIEEMNTGFRAGLIRWFPELRIIDTVAVSAEESGAAKSSNKDIVLKVQPGVYNDDSGIAENFIKEFFVRFDGDRRNMPAMFYDETSSFSLSVNTNSLREPGSGATGQKGEWSDWIRQSRNLTKLDHLHARRSRLHTGVANIAKAFETLPPTQHPPVTETTKWVFECEPMQGVPDPNGPNPVNGLFIVSHGEFVEYPNDPSKRKLRSFDRTFILGPNKAGGVRIVNDELVLRNYGGTRAFPHAQQTEEQEKAAMVAELSRRTGMNAQYSQMCLQENQWKFEIALETFQSVRANIPPEAFVN